MAGTSGGEEEESVNLKNRRPIEASSKLIEHCVYGYEAAVEAAPVEYASVSLPEGTARRLKSMIRSACRL